MARRAVLLRRCLLGGMPAATARNRVRMALEGQGMMGRSFDPDNPFGSVEALRRAMAQEGEPVSTIRVTGHHDRPMRMLARAILGDPAIERQVYAQCGHLFTARSTHNGDGTTTWTFRPGPYPDDQTPPAVP